MYVTAHYLFYMFSFFCNFILILSGCQKAVASSWFRQTPEVYGNPLIVEEVRFILKTEDIPKNIHLYYKLTFTHFWESFSFCENLKVPCCHVVLKNSPYMYVVIVLT